MYSAVDDMPILLFQGFPCTLDDLLAEVDGFPGIGVGQIRTCELALNERRIQDMCASVSNWRERWGFSSDFGKDMEIVCDLNRARLLIRDKMN